MKRTFSVIMAFVLVISTLCFGSAAAETKVETVSMRAMTSKTFTEKTAKRNYLCKVKYNDKKYIDVSFKNTSSGYSFKVSANKQTDSTRPVVKIYYYNSKNTAVVVRSIRFSVRPLGTVKFSDVKVNKGMEKNITVNNPFDFEYSFRQSDTKIAKLTNAPTKGAGMKVSYPVKGIRNGSSTVSVYLKDKKVGSFKVTVGDFPTRLLSGFKDVTLKFNSHGSSTYMSKSHVTTSQVLADTHKGASYSFVSGNEDVASTVKVDSAHSMIYACKKGTTSATVIETRGSESNVIGTINIKVVNASMAYVAKENSHFYECGIYGNGDSTEYLKKGDSLKLAPTMKERLLNNSITGSSFRRSDYEYKFTSDDTKIAAVTAAGSLTAKTAGKTKISYTITFCDKSTFTGCLFVHVD